MVRKLSLFLTIFLVVISLGCKTTDNSATTAPKYVFPPIPIFHTPEGASSSDRALLRSYEEGENVDKDEVISACIRILKAYGLVISYYDGYSVELEVYINDMIQIIRDTGAEVWIPPETTTTE